MAFKKGQSGNPAGRTPGIPTAQTRRRKALAAWGQACDIKAPENHILKHLFDEALKETSVLKALVDRMIPPTRRSETHVEIREVAQLVDLSPEQQLTEVVNLVLAGTLTIEVGQELADLMTKAARHQEALVMSDIIGRIKAGEEPVQVLRSVAGLEGEQPSAMEVRQRARVAYLKEHHGQANT